MVVGGTHSSDGIAVGNHGESDVLAIHVSQSGVVQWHQVYGGTEPEGAVTVSPCASGGHIFIAGSSSTDGDAVGPLQGIADVWIVRVDEAGEIVWQRKYGGPVIDNPTSIAETPDGGFLFLAAIGSNTTGGDIAEGMGIGGYWLVKLDSTGEILWQNRFGGSNVDTPGGMCLTMDGGCIITGYTWSNDGDVTFHYPGVADGWVVKVDSVGNLQWQKTLGGSGWDRLKAIAQAADGGYIVVGQTESVDGDVIGNHGGVDGWAVKLDTSGNLLWQRPLGGSAIDKINSVVATADGGFVLVGSANSINGDVSNNLGGNDAWVVKLDSAGTLMWDLSVGGSSDDFLGMIHQTNDGGFLFSGSSESNDGQASGNHGGRDAWLVKLGPEPVGIPEQQTHSALVVFPNPASEVVHLAYALHGPGSVRLEVRNSAGQQVLGLQRNRLMPGLQRLDVNTSVLHPGVYTLRLITEAGVLARSFVKVR